MRVKDWLALLGFEIVGGQMACYAPPSRQQKWLERFSFMETAGDRWWPIGGRRVFPAGGQEGARRAADYAKME